jgi:site-specific recombinase XerC
VPLKLNPEISEKRDGKEVYQELIQDEFLMRSSSGIGTVQEPLGHSDVKTMMICTHVLNLCGR